MCARTILKALLIVLAVSCGTVSAGVIPSSPLGLVRIKPDLAANGSVTTGYNAGTDTFTLQSSLTGYTRLVSPTSPGALNGSLVPGLNLSADITDLGALVNGTLTIDGVSPGLSLVPRQTLLTATLTAFGYSGSGASTVFEFLGTVTGGALRGDFGSRIGVILIPGSNCTYSGLFTADFAGTGNTGTVDVFAVPEPCTLGVLALGGGLALLKRRRSLRAI